MKVSLLVAMAENRVIGRDGDLPWHLPADLKRFKRLTTGHAIVMGRRTWESIGRPLPKRRSIVVSRRPDSVAPPPSPKGDGAVEGVEVVSSLEEALALAEDDDEVFVIGGAELFAAALDRADRLYVTRLHAEVEGDVRMPSFEDGSWELVAEETHDADERHAYSFTFETYERKV